MKEPFDLQQLFISYRRELGYSFVACLVAMARHWQRGDPFREIATNGVFVAVAAFGMNEILSLFGINGGQWGYLASAWLGYVGVQTLITGITARLPLPGGNNDGVSPRRKE
ncbi:phage holin family protein [Leclercia sp. Marseille-Q4284]|uniref:phage holin family protein n=1 Tax=Leclercia sp. Marseille-Q4284 TaxID=2866582 RepID=UPI001CE41E2B|nr:phage holin family protein [Leclercia sp. Marseille-Q4284]